MLYDIVYVLKDATYNEEFIYSLRSVCKYFDYRRVYIYGTQPKNVKVDRYHHVIQSGWTKWDRVQNMLTAICQNKNITPYFWLFNDDFYVTEEPEKLYYYSNGDLYRIAEGLENKYGHDTEYSRMLKHEADMLKEKGYDTRAYNTHTPLLIHRETFIEAMAEFSGVRGFRSIYGNYAKKKYGLPLRIKTCKDNKIRNAIEPISHHMPFLSSSDKSFRENEELRQFLETEFNEKCKYEV